LDYSISLNTKIRSSPAHSRKKNSWGDIAKDKDEARNAWPAAAAASDRFHFLAACVISNFERISFVLFL